LEKINILLNLGVSILGFGWEWAHYFWGRGVTTFGGSLPSGFTSGQNLLISLSGVANFGWLLLSEVYGSDGS